MTYFIRAVVTVLSITMTSFFAPAYAGGTTRDQAVTCFNQALESARAGTQFRTLIETYIHTDSVAMSIAKRERLGDFATLPESDKAQLRKAVRTYLENSTALNDIDLNSVKITAGGKPTKSHFELGGSFQRQNGQTDTFAVYVVVTPRCAFIDAEWNNARLSRHIPFTAQD